MGDASGSERNGLVGANWANIIANVSSVSCGSFTCFSSVDLSASVLDFAILSERSDLSGAGRSWKDRLGKVGMDIGNACGR